jgi:hypothetical protein
VGGDNHGVELATARYDHRRAAETFLQWLERWGLNAVPEAMVPPMDTEELRKARREAERVAKGAGRRDEVREYHRQVVDWALGRYRTTAEYCGIFATHFSPAATRVDGVEVLLDAMTVYALADVLDDHVATTLMARFDVWLGGPLLKSGQGTV